MNLPGAAVAAVRRVEMVAWLFIVIFGRGVCLLSLL
jgi:hypothetical protein